VGDFAEVKDNDLCPRCEKGVLTIENGIEVGHIFQLGTRYSEKMQATFLDRDGKRKPFVMGCYGIGIGRTLSAAIEQLADEKGIVLPPSLAPFSVSVIPLDSTDPNLLKEGERIYLELSRKGVDVLLDDREERAGVKLTDWEIIGIPYRIVLGKRGFQRGVAEVGVRQGGTVRELPLSTVVEEVHSLLSGLYEKKDLSRTSGR
jgi:prolyl-tRNA synthetase